MKGQILSLLTATLITACATIEHAANVEQPIGQPTIVGVGDVVLRVNKHRNLENAFGKADVWGRKTNEGFSELRFAGVEKSGEIVLYRKDVRIITNETTTSKMPIAITAGSANTYATGTYHGNGNYGNVNTNARTNYSSATLAPTSDFHVVIPDETIPIRIPPGEAKVPMEGHVIEIIKATPSSLEYKISKY